MAVPRQRAPCCPAARQLTRATALESIPISEAIPDHLIGAQFPMRQEATEAISACSSWTLRILNSIQHCLQKLLLAECPQFPCFPLGTGLILASALAAIKQH